MIRSTVVIMAALASLSAGAAAGLAADLSRPGEGGRWHAADGRVAGAGVWRGRARYSYYGAYGYPSSFGYGVAYAPVPARGFEYGYYGPRYLWTAPAGYDGPAFGYHEW